MTEGRARDDAREVLVVLDTNIWISSQLLNDPASAALLYALSQAGGRIGMPEVIEREVSKHGVARAREACEEIEKNLRIIRALIGYSPAIRLPGDLQVEAVAERRLAELASLFHRVPFTPEIAIRALDRVNDKKPPSLPGQQYKDSAIWEHCLDLAKNYEVHLVTEDKAFFEQRNYQKGLEKRLRDELNESDLAVQVHSAIESVLLQLTGNVASTFDTVAAANEIHSHIIDLVQSSVENAGLALGDRKDVQLEAFVTERFDVLFVTFALRYGATSASATDVDADTDSHIIVEGQCFYRPAAREVTAPRVDRIRFLTTADGQVHERKTVFGYMSAVLGAPPPVPHEIREPLPGASKFSVIELGDSAQE